ncbi:hypothetical protein EDB95_2077 [Dinghuibacter silviterrae]|uniref:Uncharacterized protein n=1 Tax=Dinghuibacter silviterrae TaxID=1539049 RepID=A0A4R8DT35_9BACT|nr:hypothetical protein EDB95_2077 [Dinghuibacter silviterrae]
MAQMFRGLAGSPGARWMIWYRTTLYRVVMVVVVIMEEVQQQVLPEEEGVI